MHFQAQKSILSKRVMAFGLILDGLGAHLGALAGSFWIILGALGVMFGASGQVFFDEREFNARSAKNTVFKGGR